MSEKIIEDINTRIEYGDYDPSIVWTRYMDFLIAYGNHMKKEYIKRTRDDEPFTWAELEEMKQELHDKVEKLYVQP